MKFRVKMLGSVLAAATVAFAAGSASAVQIIDPIGTLTINSVTETGSLGLSSTLEYTAKTGTMSYAFTEGSATTSGSVASATNVADVLYEFKIATPVDLLYGQAINSIGGANQAIGSGTIELLDVTTNTALTGVIGFSGSPFEATTISQPSVNLTSTTDTYALEVIGNIAARTGTKTTSKSDVEYGPSIFAAAVPEPATWATMFLGFGLMGATMRSARRRKTALTA